MFIVGPRTPRMSSSLEMKKKSITNIRLPKSRKTSVIFQNSALHSEENVIKKSVGKFDFDKMKKIIDEKLNQLQENSRNKIGILQPNKLETLKSSPIHHTNLLPTIHQTKKKFEPIKIPILGKPFKLLNLNHNSKNSKLTEKKHVKTSNVNHSRIIKKSAQNNKIDHHLVKPSKKTLPKLVTGSQSKKSNKKQINKTKTKINKSDHDQNNNNNNKLMK